MVISICRRCIIASVDSVMVATSYFVFAGTLFSFVLALDVAVLLSFDLLLLAAFVSLSLLDSAFSVFFCQVSNRWLHTRQRYSYVGIQLLPLSYLATRC